MKGRDDSNGFTLVELLIAVAMIGVVLSGVTTFFLGVLRQSRVQARVTSSNIEGVMGLELLRKDLAMAGYGLPWNGLVTYNESASGRLDDSTTNAPRPVASANSPGYALNGSDYLVIKSAAVSLDAASRKWTTLQNGGAIRVWGDNGFDLQGTNRLIVIAPGSNDCNFRSLVSSGGTFFKTFTQVQAGEFAPVVGQTNLAYGVSDGTDLRMPFNRADYYIDTLEVSQRCAPGTGTLVKGVISQVDGTRNPVLPLVDCVRDMQVTYRYATDPADPAGILTDDIAVVGTTALDIRSHLREVRVHILAHEGGSDPSFTYENTSVYVGDAGLGQSNNVAALRNYRWKVYTLVVSPENLGI